MATTASYKGLVPVNLIGGRPYNGGAKREYKVASNNSAAMFNGDVIALTSAGQPVARTATPTAIKIPATAADATAGIMGVMTGCRYVDANGVQQFAQYLPVNSITGGFTDVNHRPGATCANLVGLQSTATGLAQRAHHVGSAQD